MIAKKEMNSKYYGWETEREGNAFAEKPQYLIFYNLMWEGKKYFDKKRNNIQNHPKETAKRLV